VRHLQRRARMTAAMFHTARTIITVGSLIVPALLSIQYTEGISVTNPTYTIYWATWVISLFVTMCNGLVALFKLDKRYYFLHTTLEHLTSEGWQYLALTGKYSGYHTPGLAPTHENQFLYFCHAVEKIRMHQVEEEYYKLSEQTSTQQAGAATSAAKSAIADAKAAKSAAIVRIPPTPLNQEIQKLIGPEMAKLLLDQLSKLTTEDASSARQTASGSSEEETEETNEVIESQTTTTGTAPPRSPNTQNGSPRPLSVPSELPV
jgi:hypothetical protein